MFQVLYPALPSHPQHEVHKKQTKGMSGMISFYLKGELEQSSAFLSALKVFTLAESLGGYESLAELPSIMTHASVPPEVRQFPLFFKLTFSEFQFSKPKRCDEFSSSFDLKIRIFMCSQFRDQRLLEFRFS